MVQITIDVPDEMKEDILKALKIKRVIDEKSRLTEEDVEELTEKINENIWKRHKQYEASYS